MNVSWDSLFNEYCISCAEYILSSQGGERRTSLEGMERFILHSFQEYSILKIATPRVVSIWGRRYRRQNCVSCCFVVRQILWSLLKEGKVILLLFTGLLHGWRNKEQCSVLIRGRYGRKNGRKQVYDWLSIS